MAIEHQGHVDYVHDAHLHHPHGEHFDEHELTHAAASCAAGCTCGGHDAGHTHGVGCEHVAIPHLGHIDYLVDGHIHRRHGEHCDDHGAIEVL